MLDHGCFLIRPNIPVWNFGYFMGWLEQYFPVGLTNPSQVIRFQVSSEKYELNQTENSLPFLPSFLLPFGVARRLWSWNKRCLLWRRQHNFYRKNLEKSLRLHQGVRYLFIVSWRVQDRVDTLKWRASCTLARSWPQFTYLLNLVKSGPLQ